MTKIDIYSGFLGAGKTTLIKKMITEAYAGQKLVLIENEFGEIGIDGGFLQDAGINITEMNSGCICCSLVGDFGKALEQVIAQYVPERILIEPSGVGKLSDVVAAVEKVTGSQVEVGFTVAVVDAGKVKVYMKNFGEFYNNQVQTAATIILSRTDRISQEKLDTAVALLREQNPNAAIVTTPWDELSGAQLLSAMEGKSSVEAELARMEEEHHHHDEEEHHCCGHHHHEEEEHHCCGHHHHEEEEHHCCGHHHHEEEEHHCCGHHHDEEEEHHCCGHHHHEEEEHHCCGHHHDEEEEHHCCGHHHHEEEEHHCGCGHHHHEEEHHHHHDHSCSCGHDHHDHHHHADEVFTSWGVETARKFRVEDIEKALHELDEGHCGMILRAKGIVPCVDGDWIHFDYVPEEHNVRKGGADVTGKLCVIGANLNEAAVAALFGV